MAPSQISRGRRTHGQADTRKLTNMAAAVGAAASSTEHAASSAYRVPTQPPPGTLLASSDPIQRLSLLKDLSSRNANALISQMQRMEKHAFPATEAMDLSARVVLRSNTSVLVLFTQQEDTLVLLAYALCIRWQRRLLLHKICVHARYRNQGYGSRLMSSIVVQARKSRCSGIDLWVDEAREAAKRLYIRYGFIELRRVEDYYATDRAGIQMALALD